MAQAVVVLIVVAVVVNLLLLGALIARWIMHLRTPRDARPRPAIRSIDPRPPSEINAVAFQDDDPARGGDDRVVRIVSWVFIVATAVIVIVSGLWPTTQTVILLLLAGAGLFVVVLHDLLPSDALGSARFAAEGTVALSGAGVLIALTGGVTSPFFFTIPLVVAGSALVVSGKTTVGLTILGSLAFIAADLVAASPHGLDSGATALVVVDLTGLILLTYVVMVIAREQRRTRDAAIRLSTVDPLTGLFNRSFFFASVEREIARSARSGRAFCLLMLDLDDLKGINDRLGHFYGDRVLRGIGEVINSGVRRIDTAARYGGDEFVVLLPETEPAGAIVLAEKIRLGARAMPVELPDTTHRPTLSIGVVSYPDDGRTVDELMITADSAMYASKRAGKDRVSGRVVSMGRTA